MDVYRAAAALQVKAVSDVLFEDVWRCHAEIARLNTVGLTLENRPEAEFWLRTFVRVFFSHVDGVSYALRRVVLSLNELDQHRLTLAEQCVLREVSFRFRDGKIEERDAFLKPLEALELSVAHFARAFGSTFILQKGDHRFTAFKRTLGLRHTLTHPKTSQDLTLSRDHIADFSEAVAWFSNQMVALFSSSFKDLLEANST